MDLRASLLSKPRFLEWLGRNLLSRPTLLGKLTPCHSPMPWTPHGASLWAQSSSEGKQHMLWCWGKLQQPAVVRHSAPWPLIRSLGTTSAKQVSKLQGSSSAVMSPGLPKCQPRESLLPHMTYEVLAYGLHPLGLRLSSAAADCSVCVRAEHLSNVAGNLEPQDLAAECVPWAILPLTATKDREGLAALAQATGSNMHALMSSNGHIVIAKRMFEGGRSCSAWLVLMVAGRR